MGSCQTRAQQVGCKISSGYVRGRPTAAPDRRIKVKTLKRCKEQRDKGWQNGSTERSDGSRGQMSSAWQGHFNVGFQDRRRKLPKVPPTFKEYVKGGVMMHKGLMTTGSRCPLDLATRPLPLAPIPSPQPRQLSDLHLQPPICPPRVSF